ncbi:MAG: hypothetical protein LBQ50_00090 [Planctomycetaceae bacterium]|nr:hypothetical protein [Planctomycetaceae bacterium]
MRIHDIDVASGLIRSAKRLNNRLLIGLIPNLTLLSSLARLKEKSIDPKKQHVTVYFVFND